jgi:hypothetical protein
MPPIDTTREFSRVEREKVSEASHVFHGQSTFAKDTLHGLSKASVITVVCCCRCITNLLGRVVVLSCNFAPFFYS